MMFHGEFQHILLRASPMMDVMVRDYVVMISSLRFEMMLERKQGICK